MNPAIYDEDQSQIGGDAGYGKIFKEGSLGGEYNHQYEELYQKKHLQKWF